MKKQTIILLMTLLSFLSYAHVADAKRFGGGKSFGMFKKSSPKKSFNTQGKSQSATSKTAAGAAAKSGASKWLGPLAGLAIGGLFAAMLFGDGFEGLQIMDILLFAGIAFILFKIFVRRRETQQPEAVYNREELDPSNNSSSDNTSARENINNEHVAPSRDTSNGSSIFGSALSNKAQPVLDKPDWFDEESFLEGAKGHFKTLQVAWDSLNLVDVRSYCTQELYDLLAEEMKTMKVGENVTVVDELHAETADMAIDGSNFVVSVRFSGFISENKGEDAHAFTEIWHIRRDVSNEGNWEVAGIQQVA